MTAKEQYNEIIGNKVVKNLEKRNMSGYYCKTKEDALKQIETFLYDDATIGWGGSVSLDEIGLFPVLNKGNFNLLDSSKAKNDKEKKQIERDCFSSDIYLLSSNAITRDGTLYNVDGNGNRVAALIYGPRQVVIVAGVNKICFDEDEALRRIRNVAAPINTIRLDLNTPCNKTAECASCLVDDCICANIVKTRYSRDPNRIKVVIVGEELGY